MTYERIAWLIVHFKKEVKLSTDVYIDERVERSRRRRRLTVCCSAGRGHAVFGSWTSCWPAPASVLSSSPASASPPASDRNCAGSNPWAPAETAPWSSRWSPRRPRSSAATDTCDAADTYPLPLYIAQATRHPTHHNILNYVFTWSFLLNDVLRGNGQKWCIWAQKYPVSRLRLTQVGFLQWSDSYRRKIGIHSFLR